MLTFRSQTCHVKQSHITDTQITLSFPALVNRPVFMVLLLIDPRIIRQRCLVNIVLLAATQISWDWQGILSSVYSEQVLFEAGWGRRLEVHSGILQKALVTLHHHHESPLLRNLFTYTGGRVANGHEIPLENLIQIVSVVTKDWSGSQKVWV